jgi:selenocysteine-specific elongation factor
VVLRTETTVGGGIVLDPAPPRRRDAARLELLERGDPVSIVHAIVHEPVTAAQLEAHGLLTPGELAAGLATLSCAGDFYFAQEWLDDLIQTLRQRLAERAQTSPLDPGIPLGELLTPQPWAADVLHKLPFERRGGRAYLPGSTPSLGEHEAAAAELEARLGLEPIKVDDQKLARFLEEQSRLVRLGDNLAVSHGAYEHARDALVAECEAAGSITLARFRDLLGVGRRAAQLLLERFDADGLTRRVGDARVLRRAAQRRL